MNIAGIVNNESHGSRESIGLAMVFVGMFHDLLVLITILISFGLSEPVSEVSKDLGDVVSIKSEVEVTDLATLTQEGLINEMPPLLVGSTLVLDLIGKRGTLHEWVVLFALGPLWIRLLQFFENVD